MKRLFSLFLLSVLIVVIAGMLSAPAPEGMPSAPAPDGMPRDADALVLTAVNDTAFMLVNGRIVIDVVANDEDNNAGCKTFQLVRLLEGPFNSNLKFRDSTHIDRRQVNNFGDDVLVYVPLPDFTGRDSLEYEVHSVDEDCPNSIDSAWVFVNVTRAPEAQNDTLQVLPDSLNTLPVLANDTDPDDEPLTVDSLGVLPQNGTAAIADGALTYTPDDDYIGPDTLLYYVSDDKRAIDSAWVFLTVNTPPMAVEDSVTTLPVTPVTIDVLDNDTDPEDGELTIGDILDGPSNGGVAVNGDVTYTPDAGFVGIDSFSYVAVDPLGGMDTTTVTVSVNTPPVAVDDAAGALFGTAVDIDVLVNDTDADGDALTVESIVDPPDNGTATVIDGGSQVRYTPDDDFFGVDTFRYAAADVRGGMDEATVTVTVSADAAVQFIHNALPAGPVDLYVNDTRVLDDFDFRTATSYLAVPAGDAMVDVTEGSAADNSAPFFTTTLSLTPQEAYIAIANGVAGQNFDILVKADARPTASDTSKAEFFIAHGVLDAPASGVDIHLLDPFNENLPSQTLADDINFEELSDYLSLDPALFNIDATSFNGSTVYDAYHFDLETFGGKTFTLLLSGLLSPATGEPAFAVVGFDADGNPLMLDVATATEDVVELPTAFILQGNYPNPFNPTTTIHFDLPARAEVRVAIYDLLGRQVLALPAQILEAGAARRVAVDAASLASGTYLYRLTAQTQNTLHVATGRMVLVK